MGILWAHASAIGCIVLINMIDSLITSWSCMLWVTDWRSNLTIPPATSPQDHDTRVAETAVVGFPHDTFGEGTCTLE